MINPYSTDSIISRTSRNPTNPAIAFGMRSVILLTFLSAILASHVSRIDAEDPDWAMAEVRRGARTMNDVFQRRLEYPMTYRFARGALEKNLHEKRDTHGFRIGAHLALVHWLSKLPEDLEWRPKALARHRDVSHWMMRDAPVDPARVAATVASTLALSPDEGRWLLDILNGSAANNATPPAQPSQ